MKAIVAIARDQLSDIYHRHLFVFGAVIVGLVLVGAALQMHFLPAPRLTLAGTLESLLQLLILFTLIAFCTAFSADLDRGTIRVVLGKPLSRAQYTLGKVLGCTAFVTGYLLFSVWAVTLLAFLYGVPTPVTLAGVGGPLLGSLMLGCSGMMLAALMPPLLAGVLALVLRAETFLPIASSHTHHWLITACRVATWVLPENFAGDLAGARPLDATLRIGAVVGYCLVLVALTIVIRRRQDLVGEGRG